MSAAALANSPAAYDARRFGVNGHAPTAELDPLPTTDFRLAATIGCLEWCWAQQPPGTPRAVLDVAAGGGNLGWWARLHDVPAFAYHATEQSSAQLGLIRGRVPDASLAEWRCDPEELGGLSLLDALGCSPDVFAREYPTVLVSHGVEHHADPYALLDNCWPLVQPGGFLVLVSARNDAHRTHFARYQWDDLIALASHYAGFMNPLVVWEGDYWTDLFVAIPKPPATTDTEGAQGQ